jgi:phosphoglycolate phosphatase-like HAD superfamily hydrolase
MIAMPSNSPAFTVARRAIDGVLFDLDGVVTHTAQLHAAAWKELFDGYLQQRAAREHASVQPFDADTDYRRYVDGKPRNQGIESFLSSRGIELPYGDPTDAPEVEGALVERKKFSIAVHVRDVARDDEGTVEAIVNDVLARNPGLRKGHGKKVFELQPRLDWHKGKAVLWLLQALELDGPEVLPLYIGDDLTDEEAFRRLADRGIGIIVEEGSRPTAASYVLKHPGEVHAFLRQLISWLDG